ncbi:MAG: peptidoglycan-binding domain-containing protein [Patescibacteria group bacterium]
MYKLHNLSVFIINLVKINMMSRKYFVILGLFLVAGFLFFNVSSAQAIIRSWNGGGDAHTWTDPLNWGGVSNGSYPGEIATDDVIIASSTSSLGPLFVYATSTTPFGVNTLQIQNGWTLYIGGANLGASSTVSVIGTSTLALATSTYGSGTLTLGQTAAGTPLTKSATATFTAATGTVAYIGGGTGEVVVASTTFYNLKLTPTSTAAVRTYTMGYRSIAATEVAQSATTTVSNVFTISQAAKADFLGKADLLLSGSGTPLVYVSTGSFMQSSRIVYSSASATNIATGTYANLVLTGAITKTLLGNTTATSTLTIPASGTLAVGNYTLTVTSATVTNAGTLTIGATGVVTATSATWANTGTVTETSGGSIVYAGSGILSDAAGDSAVTTFGNADSFPVVHIEITDPTLNLLTTKDTYSVTVTAVSGITDSETVTLTETTVTSGVFRGSIGFQLAGSDSSGVLDYQGGGTVTYAWTDPQESGDTLTSTASFTGTAPGGGSGSSGSSSSSAVTAVTTTTTTATPVTETTTTTTAPVTTVSGPTLESVQTKVASAIAKIAALPANPTASELAVVQAEIAAILADLQTLTATTPSAPQGAALGYTFVRPLAFGMSHNDVSNLQTALKTDSSIYPGGKVTGYFGPATLLAIKKFQEKYGIASEGQSGYGNVGPKTRAKLNELFGRSQ